jgi:hypothetical protein
MVLQWAPAPASGQRKSKAGRDGRVYEKTARNSERDDANANKLDSPEHHIYRLILITTALWPTRDLS